MQAHIRLCFRYFQCLSVLGAICLGGAQSAHANCVASGSNLPLDLALPSTSIAVSPNLPLGATIGSVRVAAPQDIPFVCSGASNAREAQLAIAPVPVPDFAGVYSTNIPGVGMRITASGGNYAGIDDGPRLAPYKVALPKDAKHLTGFALQVDFIKTGPVQNGTLAAGKLVTVSAGGTELVGVAIPNDAVVFAANQCDAVHVGGEVGMGVSNMGAFTNETIAVGLGCNPSIGVMVQVNQGYVYGSAPLLNREDTYKKVAANPANISTHRPGRGLLNPNSIDATGAGTNFSSNAFDSSTSASGSPGGNGFGGNVFRR
jgi:hypothetical protein